MTQTHQTKKDVTPVPPHATDVSTNSHTPKTLQTAIGDFNELEQKKDHEKESILSSSDTVFDVGGDNKADDGAIITDTKYKRWRLTAAMQQAFGSWIGKKQKQLSTAIIEQDTDRISTDNTSPVSQKPAPKEAATYAAVAPVNTVTQVKRPKDPARRKPNKTASTLRIKPKDVTQEIGDTTPQWTHLVEDVPHTASAVTKQPTVHATSTNVTLLLEAPDPIKRLPPRYKNIVPAKNVQKVFRQTKPIHDTTSSDVRVETVYKEVRKPSTPLHTQLSVQPTPTQTAVPKSNNTPTNAKSALPTNIIKEITPTAQNEAITIPAVAAVSPAPLRALDVPTAPTEAPISTPKKKFSFAATITDENNRSLLTTAALTLVLLLVIGISSLIGKQSEQTNISVVPPLSSVMTIDRTSKLDLTSNTLPVAARDASKENASITQFVSKSNAVTPADQIYRWSSLIASNFTVLGIGAINTKPFIILQAENHDRALSSMLVLEKNIPEQFRTLFSITQTTQFTDKTIGSFDVRAMQSGTTEVVAYTISDTGITVITSDVGTLAILLAALK